ncbi:peptidylprolyl isomerase [Mesorhizobium sp. M1C.F.Ca.ET.193.01.1.1]|uniref:peptidylprolyl isomerase n=1 Tax=unclassified Mesorhizobium TaxID=325217 RepID=UPI000FD5BA19|nr:MULTISPECIES: peptidylprolyl isomerase [unclassified Mesorhizobium]TGS98154.1 peptidylprolyl isomerase [bacterium M00.F.Ca.ET.177.01.1.1]RWA63467.1 MAG: peptidylprolyl isomerase [Mesorhizobium sp.]RWB95146.1 MAG: peptidylprolyl isomerase [Mesorhizobium sp.]RWK06384.1 MAG: peptidylprolyl isomerase [Mesorhizobium sp.]RWK17720.1 MAG: peptidylprolyl isomerase [Mesorhizobium sp.]
MAALVIDHSAGRKSSEHPHEHRPAVPDTAPSRERVAMPPVTVNGVAISRKAIAAEVQNFPARNPGEGWRAATRALVIRELLLQEARRLDIAVEQRTDQDGRRETIEDALVRGLIEREVRVPEADEEMLRRFYENNLRRFVTPPLHEADHILIAARRDDREAFDAARERALALRSSLAAAPERFAAVARDCSDCPSGALGGSLGQIGPGDTTPEFEAALVDLAPGDISPPVETRYGVHLIRLTRRIDGRQLPFEAVRERIAAYLAEHVSRQATAQYVSLLVGGADIRGIAIDGASSPLVQ